MANIDANGVITDLRPKGSLDGQQGNKDFLRIDKSLSEIATKGVQAQAEARKNLALGDAATKNVQKSVTDSTPNALMINGAWGLGASGVGMVDSDILSPTSIGNTFLIKVAALQIVILAVMERAFTCRMDRTVITNRD